MRKLLLVLLLLPRVAFAQAAAQPKLRQMDVGSSSDGTPTALSGCSAQRIDSAVTCGGTSGFDVHGYNLLTFFINYTRSGATGNITFNIECTNDPNGSSGTWFPVQGSSISSGADTLSLLVPTKATASASQKFPYSVGINYQRCKMTNLVVAGGAPAAGDLATVYATVSVSPAF